MYLRKSHSVKITIQFLRALVGERQSEVYQETRLLPNYPNPFNPETWIPYQLAKAADVSVKIYDVGGRLVRTVSVGFKPVGILPYTRASSLLGWTERDRRTCFKWYLLFTVLVGRFRCDPASGNSKIVALCFSSPPSGVYDSGK